MWLAMSVSGADDRTVQWVIGLVGVGTGSFLLLAPRKMLASEPPTPASPAAAAMQHLAWTWLRLTGVGCILMSPSMMFPDDTIRLTLVTGAAAVNIAAAAPLLRARLKSNRQS
jgi:hypothetical protein